MTAFVTALEIFADMPAFSECPYRLRLHLGNGTETDLVMAPLQVYPWMLHAAYTGN